MKIRDVKLLCVQRSSRLAISFLRFDIGLPYWKVTAIEKLHHKCNELGLDKVKSIAIAINNTGISILAVLVNQKD